MSMNITWTAHVVLLEADMDRRTAKRSALILVAAHCLAQNTILNRRGYVEGNMLVLAALVSIGKGAGLSLAELGLNPRVNRKDLRLGGVFIALTATGALAALIHPRTRELLRDERSHDQSSRVIAYKSLARFPIGTALFEGARI